MSMRESIKARLARLKKKVESKKKPKKEDK